MTLETVDEIYQRAAERKGGDAKLNVLLAAQKQGIDELTDDRILSEMTKKIFQSGFVWRVVEKKWPDFEEAFFNFDIEKILMMPEEMLEQKASDPKIIRNFNKVKTIKANAQMMFEERQNGHSFAEFIARWPTADIIGLWAYLKKNGQRLGGNTGPYALRMLGKDTFLLSRDVEGYFRAHDLISGGLHTKSTLKTIQQSFNHWHQESGMSLSQLSRLVAFSTGDNQLIS
ncbi:DNA-3-methyladenine glycosylase I [Thalassotalea sp. PP2-459]|uniref:DNA-3-methyladenine glycosylase I n=1 Tax=Thalassotalea sp. PP2-459 TaxID=1742724 RepID=UPI0009451F4A|nr:DNA-3-methyladenine glycosylase I [Thalassotalea sp. PP2-459]OKY25082.1 3-methyladenine DNA glycosylase [Thalassotalea sp. PP2-459]